MKVHKGAGGHHVDMEIFLVRPLLQPFLESRPAVAAAVVHDDSHRMVGFLFSRVDHSVGGIDEHRQNGSHQKSDIKTVFIHDFSSFALYFPSSRSC